MSIKYQTMTIANNVNTAAIIISDTVDLRFNLGIFIKATFTGTATGKIELQASNDGAIWTTIAEENVSANRAYINLGDIYAPYLRVFKTADGAGVATITATIKGV